MPPQPMLLVPPMPQTPRASSPPAGGRGRAHVRAPSSSSSPPQIPPQPLMPLTPLAAQEQGQDHGQEQEQEHEQGWRQRAALAPPVPPMPPVPRPWPTTALMVPA